MHFSLSFFFYSYADPRDLHSFPTRRSSDLQTLRKAGQLQQSLDAAKRAVAINPKVENGIQFVLVTFGDLKQIDSALAWARSEEHTSELQSRRDLVCRLLLEKKKKRLNSFSS